MMQACSGDAVDMPIAVGVGEADGCPEIDVHAVEGCVGLE